MKCVTIRGVKTHLAQLLRRIRDGEPFVMAWSGGSIVQVSPYQGDEVPPRQPGSMKGKIRMGDDFDAPDAELERLFYGEEP
jgi:antitoxin (DNA-binding transcriptional repressor) of toxin-antitoxin stability system